MDFFCFKKKPFSQIHFSASFVSIRASRHTKSIATIAGSSRLRSNSSYKIIFRVWEEFPWQKLDQSSYDCREFCKGKCPKLGFSYDNNMRSLFNKPVQVLFLCPWEVIYKGKCRGCVRILKPKRYSFDDISAMYQRNLNFIGSQWPLGPQLSIAGLLDL